MKKVLLMALCFTGFAVHSQDELTDQEKAYQDSINSLNEASAVVAEAQEAYNAGILLFESK